MERGEAYSFLVGTPDGKRSFGRPKCRWEDNIMMDLQEMMWRYGLDQAYSG